MLTRFNGFVFDETYQFFLVQGGKAGVEPPTLLAAGLSEAITIPSHTVTEIEITMHCIDVKPSFISGGSEPASVVNDVFQLAPGKTWQAAWKINGLEGLDKFKVFDSDAISGGNAEVPEKASLTDFELDDFEPDNLELDDATVTADIAGLQGAAYFNLFYKPLANKSWSGFNNGTAPVWIIRNGLNDKPQDGNTDFQALAGGDSAKNGNGAVRFAVAAPPPGNLIEDRSLWITKPLKTPVDDTEAKIEFTLNQGGTVYYAVVDKITPAAPSAYTLGTFTTAGTFPGMGTYEITLTMTDMQDVVWLMLMASSGATVVKSKPVEAPSPMNKTEAEAYLARAQVGKDSADPPVHLALNTALSKSERETLIANDGTLSSGGKIQSMDLYLSFTDPVPSSSFGGPDTNPTTYLRSVKAPNITKIGDIAFRACITLETADFPQATEIDKTAFWDCRKLTMVNFPVATTFHRGAFASCDILTTVSFPEATSIANCFLDHNSFVTTVSLPKVKNIGGAAFRETNLTTLYLPAGPPALVDSESESGDTGRVFEGTGSGGILTIVVPPGSKDAYIKWLEDNDNRLGDNHKTIIITEGSPPAGP
jgi:hypothetical protein